VDVVRFGLGLRALRLRRRWTQAQLAERAGISRAVIYRIERARGDRVAVHTLVAVAAALGARVDVRLLWQGEGLDRLLDARHAKLVERTIALLDRYGWETAAEVSFNVRGERGSIDVLGFHAPSRCLAVIEVKSVVPDLQVMLVTLDRKGRLAREMACERGWASESVTRLLVLPGDRTARRRVELHAATFKSALHAGTVAVRRWLQRPVGTCHGIMFLTDAPQESSRQGIARRGTSVKGGSRSN
jgi:transcriptional regulator with XRE-family HTH domain